MLDVAQKAARLDLVAAERVSLLGHLLDGGRTSAEPSGLVLHLARGKDAQREHGGLVSHGL